MSILVKNDFTSLVTHQLREPLTNIKWALSILINGEVGNISIEQKDVVLRAFESNERALKLIDTMLKADRVDSNNFDLYPVESDIVDICRKVVDELLPHANKKKINFEFVADHKSTPLVYVDADYARESIMNLIENAIHYTSEKGTVKVKISSNKDGVIISVSDTGIGIPKEDNDKIFGRFFRAKNALSSGVHGSGLGLFIVKKVIEKHGGKIWFESEENKGSEFFVFFPLENKVYSTPISQQN